MSRRSEVRPSEEGESTGGTARKQQQVRDTAVKRRPRPNRNCRGTETVQRPRHGQRTERFQRTRSWPAAVGWFGSFGIGFVLFAKDNYAAFSGVNQYLPAFLANYRADFFMQVLPAWILAVVLYTLCSALQQKTSSPSRQPRTA